MFSLSFYKKEKLVSSGRVKISFIFKFHNQLLVEDDDRNKKKKPIFD